MIQCRLVKVLIIIDKKKIRPVRPLADVRQID